MLRSTRKGQTKRSMAKESRLKWLALEPTRLGRRSGTSTQASWRGTCADLGWLDWLDWLDWSLVWSGLVLTASTQLKVLKLVVWCQVPGRVPTLIHSSLLRSAAGRILVCAVPSCIVHTWMESGQVTCDGIRSQVYRRTRYTCPCLRTNGVPASASMSEPGVGLFEAQPSSFGPDWRCQSTQTRPDHLRAGEIRPRL